MEKLLYIQASPRGDRSKSTQVAGAFLDSCRKNYPDDEIRILNVFEEDLPAFDGFAVQAKYTIMHGKEHTAEERQAWDAVEKVIADFKDADKYLLSVPMWNFSIPYPLKQYIDIIVQPGYTFSADENGYEGLIKGKPILVIYSRGGVYSEDSGAAGFDLQKKYIEQILGFMGFENIQSIMVEPTLHGQPEDIQKMIDGSVEKARSIADVF